MQVNEKISILQNLIKRKVTYEEIAKILGLGSGQALRNRVTRKQPLKDYEEKQIDDFFNIEIEQNKTYLTNKNNDSITADYYPDIFGSCGSGSFVLSETKEKINIPVNCFLKPFSQSAKYSVITARGNSMYPAIYDKDRLIVQHWNGEQIIDNQIYVFCYRDEIFVKRLSKNVNQLVITSDNKDFDTIKLLGEDLNNVFVIGQIVGLMRDLR